MSTIFIMRVLVRVVFKVIVGWLFRYVFLLVRGC